MQDDVSGVDDLKKKLYARAGGPPPRTRRQLHEHSYDVASGWTHEEDQQQEVINSETAVRDAEQMLRDLHEGKVPGGQVPTGPAIMRDSRLTEEAVQFRAKKRTASRVVWTIFLAAFVFCIVSLGVAGYSFFLKGPVSCDNVGIEISGPVSIPAGEELVLQVGVLNKNVTAMQLTDLVVDFPEGTRSPSDVAIDLPILREDLGTIEPGARTRTTVRSVLFGKEKTEAEIQTRVEYRIQESNAIFSCEAPYKVVISAAPVTVVVEAVNEIASGQELTMVVRVTSNADNILKNMALKAQFPFGFELREAVPKPSVGENLWVFGDLQPGSERMITIKGAVLGQVTEDRYFTFEVGGQDQDSPDRIVTAFETIEHPLTISAPFLKLALLSDGDTGEGESVISPGQAVTTRVRWENTLSYPLYNVEITANIQGNLVNPASVGAGGGYWRSIDMTALWNQNTSGALARVNPGASGEFTLTFDTRDLPPNASAENSLFLVELSAQGQRIFDEAGSKPQTLQSFSRRVFKVAGQIMLRPKVVYGIGPFSNAGPYPPRAEVETSYTVIWELTNTMNDAKDIVVTARLPVYVKWLGAVLPNDGSLSYNETTKELAWKAGSLPAGTGSKFAPRQIAFQVAFLPSLTQVGTAPELVTNHSLSGVDSFTDRVLQTTYQDLTTKLVGDTSIPNPGRGLVVQ